MAKIAVALGYSFSSISLPRASAWVVSAQVCKRQRLLTKTATVCFLQKRPIYRMETTVADELRIGLSELLRKAMIDQDADFLKEDDGERPRRSWRWRSKSTWEPPVTSGAPDAQDSATATASAPGTRG